MKREGLKILFRADGNSNTGLGHLYRLFSLVEMYKEYFDVQFITSETSTISVIPQGYNTTLIPAEVSIIEEPNWLSKKFSAEEYCVIADGYQFVSNYQKKIKEKGFRLIYIDDLAKEFMYADLVINHSPGLESRNFNKASYTKLALGTSFALLRPSFLTAAKENRTIAEIKSAFVCFGGADPYNLSKKAAEALLDIISIDKVHVVLGGAYMHKSMFDLKTKNPSKVYLHKNLSEKDLLNIMKSCQIAIVPSSTILYELCCVKMPILSGYYVDNQESIYKGFLDQNAIYGMGNIKDITTQGFLEHLEVVLQQNNAIQLVKQAQLFDEHIRKRHLKLISELC